MEAQISVTIWTLLRPHKMSGGSVYCHLFNRLRNQKLKGSIIFLCSFLCFLCFHNLRDSDPNTGLPTVTALVSQWGLAGLALPRSPFCSLHLPPSLPSILGRTCSRARGLVGSGMRDVPPHGHLCRERRLRGIRETVRGPPKETGPCMPETQAQI